MDLRADRPRTSLRLLGLEDAGRLPGASFRLGPYQIVAALGAGGMEEVYQAAQLAALRSQSSSDGNSAAPCPLGGPFHGEVPTRRATPGRTDWGIPYLVMELLQGRTLRERVCRAQPASGNPWNKWWPSPTA